MQDYLLVLKDLKLEIEKSLQAEHLVHNRVPEQQDLVDKIIAKKKLQIEALENVLKTLQK